MTDHVRERCAEIARTLKSRTDGPVRADWQLGYAAACREIEELIRAFDLPLTSADFQDRVAPWMQACFGPEISRDKIERNHRFLEEALELVQALGCTSDEAHQLVDYTFSREVGQPFQEVGGVMVTLAALCLASELDMDAAAETEPARIWTKVDQIRAKQAAKPKHSPLPAALGETRQAQDPISGETVTIRNDLVRRLRGEYACGPTLPNGDPEFGWRRFGEPSAINLEAASEIERLQAALASAPQPACSVCGVCLDADDIQALKSIQQPACVGEEPDTVAHTDGEDGEVIGWHVEWDANTDFVYCGEASNHELDAHEEEPVEIEGNGFYLFVKDTAGPGMGRLIGRAADANAAFEIVSAFRDARAKRSLSPAPSPQAGGDTSNMVRTDELIVALNEHYLAGVVCNHKRGTDRAQCSCTIWRGSEMANVQSAVGEWILHVVEILSARREG